MEFPVAIHKDAGSAYGVSVPDIPGCHSAGDSLEEALTNVRQAIKLHVATLVGTGRRPVFSASTLNELRGSAPYADADWALVEVDL
jgi:predicted RNase H-like HicB family nuclease